MAAAAPAGERLPDDLVLEILACASTDIVALFRCAVTCKRWRALVSDLSLLRRRWSERTFHRSSLVGFFVRQQQQQHDDDKGLLEPVFIPPSSVSVLGSRPRSLASFIPGLPYGELDGAVPLTARHGLLLVRLARKASDDPARLAVCNLLAGTCDVLPPLKRGVFTVNCAIITSADCHSSNDRRGPSPLSPNYQSTFFKVLAIVADDTRNDFREYNNLYTYSSAGPDWSEPTNCFNAFGWYNELNLVSIQWRNKVVVCGGRAYWIMVLMPQYYILGVSIETGGISLWEIPMEQDATRKYIGSPTLFVNADGSLSIFRIQEEGLVLDICTKADDDEWHYAREVKLTSPKNWNPSLVHVWSGEKSGVLIITDTFKCVHIVDVESGLMEDVSEKFRSSYGMMAVPMEIDWPALFMSRLGGG